MLNYEYSGIVTFALKPEKYTVQLILNYVSDCNCVALYISTVFGIFSWCTNDFGIQLYTFIHEQM